MRQQAREERARLHGVAPAQRASSLQLYSAVNAQTAVARAQVPPPAAVSQFPDSVCEWGC